jgi:hypothetical protein
MVVETGGDNLRIRFGDQAVVLNKEAARAMVKIVQEKLNKMDAIEPGEAVAVDDMRMPFIPDAVAEDPTAINVLAAWVLRPEKGGDFTVVVNPRWEDPGVWGIALADIARHVSRSYSAKDNVPEEVVLERIRELIEKEFDKQTSPITGSQVPIQ